MNHCSEDTVRVLIRVRPKLQVNLSGNDESISNNLTIDEKNNAISIGRGEKKGISEYKFTSVLGPQVTQVDVFNRCSDVVQESINGINCCIMAYGQTSSGKTHTMLGKGWEDFAMNSKSRKEKDKTCLPTVLAIDTEIEQREQIGIIKVSEQIESAYSDSGEDNDSLLGGTSNSVNTSINANNNNIDLNKSQPLPPSTSSGGMSNQGIIPRLVVELFQTLEYKRKNSGQTSQGINKFNYCVYGQFMQIYNEKLYDLLLDKSRSNPLQIRETSTSDGTSSVSGEMSGSGGGGTSVHVKGLTQHKVQNKDDVFQLLKKGIRNRAIRATDYNHESSRSHSIFQLIVVVEEPDEDGMMYTRRSTMSLVDLAGSEKWITNAHAAANASLINNGANGLNPSDSGLHTPSSSVQIASGSGFASLFGQNQQSANNLNSTGNNQGMNSNTNTNANGVMSIDSGANNGELTDAQKELTHINTSLHILGLCVSALIEPGRKHIPYRDSVLTRLLQDSLSGNGRTILIGTVHESEFYREETYSTLQFASRASKIKVVFTPSITITEQALSMDLAKKQINSLKQKLAELQLQQQQQASLPPISSENTHYEDRDAQGKEDRDFRGKTEEAFNNEQLKEKVSEMFRENNNLRKQILILQEEVSEQKGQLKQRRRKIDSRDRGSGGESSSECDSDDENSDDDDSVHYKRRQVADTSATSVSKAKDLRVRSFREPKEQERSSRKVAGVRTSHDSQGSASRVPRLPALSPHPSISKQKLKLAQKPSQSQVQPNRGKKYDDGYDSAVSNISMRSQESLSRRSQPHSTLAQNATSNKNVKSKPMANDRGRVRNGNGVGGGGNSNNKQSVNNRNNADRQSKDRTRQSGNGSGHTNGRISGISGKVRSSKDRKVDERRRKEEKLKGNKDRKDGGSVRVRGSNDNNGTKSSKTNSNSNHNSKHRGRVAESSESEEEEERYSQPNPSHNQHQSSVSTVYNSPARNQQQQHPPYQPHAQSQYGYNPNSNQDNGYVANKKHQATVDMYNSINNVNAGNSPGTGTKHQYQYQSSYTPHNQTNNNTNTYMNTNANATTDGDESYAFGLSSPSNAAYQSFLASNALSKQAVIRRSQEGVSNGNSNGNQGQGMSSNGSYGQLQNPGSNSSANMYNYQPNGNAYSNQGHGNHSNNTNNANNNAIASRGSTGMSTSRAPAESSQVSGRRTGDSTGRSETYGNINCKSGGMYSPDRVNDAFAAANAALGAGNAGGSMNSMLGGGMHYGNGTHGSSVPDLTYKPGAYMQQSQSNAAISSSYMSSTDNNTTAPNPNSNSNSNSNPTPVNTISAASYTNNGLCKKHGLDSCILCQMSGDAKSRKSSAAAGGRSVSGGGYLSNKVSPSKGQEDTLGMSGYGYTSKVGGLSNSNPVPVHDGTSTTTSTPIPNPINVNLSSSLGRFDVNGLGSVGSVGNGSVGGVSPYIPSSSTPNYYPSTTGTGTGSASGSTAAAGVVCSNHGVKDCLLCAMRAGTLNLNGSMSVANSTNSMGLNSSINSSVGGLHMSGGGNMGMNLSQLNLKQSTDSFTQPIISNTPHIGTSGGAAGGLSGSRLNSSSGRPISNQQSYLSASFAHAQQQPPLSNSLHNFGSTGIGLGQNQGLNPSNNNANANPNPNPNPIDRTSSTGSSRGDDYVSTGNYAAHFANRATPLSTPPGSSEPGGLYGFVRTEAE